MLAPIYKITFYKIKDVSKKMLQMQMRDLASA